MCAPVQMDALLGVLAAPDPEAHADTCVVEARLGDRSDTAAHRRLRLPSRSKTRISHSQRSTAPQV
jgi:hypothetical protein